MTFNKNCKLYPPGWILHPLSQSMVIPISRNSFPIAVAIDDWEMSKKDKARSLRMGHKINFKQLIISFD